MNKNLFVHLENTLNRIAQCDPEFLARLSKHQNKTLALCLIGLNLNLFFIIHADRLQLTTEQPTVITATIITTPLSLLSLLRNPQQKMHMFMDDSVLIKGDTTFCQALFTLLQEFEIDWEEYLARLTNDAIAVTLTRFFRQAKHMTQVTQQELAQNTQEYLQYEAQVLTPPLQVQHFLSAVDVLVDDSARLAARIAQLEQADLLNKAQTDL